MNGHDTLDEVSKSTSRGLPVPPQPSPHLFEQLRDDCVEMRVDRLFGVVDQRPPDQNHRVLDFGIWIVLVAIQLWNEGCDMRRIELGTRELCDSCESKGRSSLCVDSRLVVREVHEFVDQVGLTKIRR